MSTIARRRALAPAAVVAAGYSGAVLADSPVSYWRLDEPSGTTAADQQGNNPGTYTGGFTLGSTGATSDGDNAVSLNGSSGQITCPDNVDLRFTGSFTWEAWVNMPDNSGYYAILGKDASNQQYRWYIAASTGIPTAGWSGGGWAATVAVPTGSYQHVAVTYDTANLRFYLNGSLTDTVANAATIGNHTGSFALGSGYPGTNFYKGVLDEVAVYNTMLSGARIAAHYAAR